MIKRNLLIAFVAFAGLLLNMHIL